MEIFDKIAWIYDPLVRLSGRSKTYAKKIKFVANLKKSDVVLDVGGGTGLIASFISDSVKKISIIDPSKKMMEKSKSDKIEKVYGTVLDMKFKDNTFDVVYCVDTFHHFTNGYKQKDFNNIFHNSIKEMLRVLKKNGVLVIIDFDTKKIRGKIINLFEKFFFKGSSKFNSRDELRNLFYNFKVKIEFFDLDNSCYIAKISKLIQPSIYQS